MADKVFLQESKEFQLKLDLGKVLGQGRRNPGSTDKVIFEIVVQAIRQAVDSLGGKKAEVVASDNLWWREGIRYDTADARLKANHLTLAIEATDKRTKLKCKQHEFVPELLFRKPEHAVVYPDIQASGGYRKHDTTLKREQDLHLDNLKYCASGSLYIKGRRTDVRDTAFFSHYFPGLDGLFPEPVPLQEVSHWDEAIFDDMSARWGSTEVDSWMLVNRWDYGTKALLEAELSFKTIRKMDDEWDRRVLPEASRLYLALRATGQFTEFPPIFTFADPVSSVDIVEAPEAVAA